MILKNNSEKVIKLVRYYETLGFADKLRLAINIFESDYIKIKSDKMSAQVMEMTEKEQSDFVYEILYDIYSIIKIAS